MRNTQTIYIVLFILFEFLLFWSYNENSFLLYLILLQAFEEDKKAFWIVIWMNITNNNIPFNNDSYMLFSEPFEPPVNQDVLKQKYGINKA